MPKSSKISYSLHQQGFLEPLSNMYFAQKIIGIDLPTTSFSDYNCFGMELEGRTFSENASSKYPYGMNGQMKDDEIYGEGNAYSAQFWEYDARLGRRWNLDPKPTDSYSPYSCFLDNPIKFSDPMGDTILINLFDPNSIEYTQAETLIKNPKNDGVFIVAGHSNSTHMQAYNSTTKAYDIYQNDLTKFDDLLRTKNKKYRKSMEKNKEITIILAGCNTASKEYYDGSEKIVTPGKPFAQRFSEIESMQNNEIIGADGYFEMGPYPKSINTPHFFISQPDKTTPQGEFGNSNNGGLITFKNGKAISKTTYSLGSVNPENSKPDVIIKKSTDY